ncbi:MAG: glycosyltransferase family 39 protein [Solirubrobacterales bacterium]
MSRRWLYALVAITALGAVVRFATLGVQSYDHDEAVTAARILHPSLFTTMSEVADSERSPPLYYILSWLWSRPFGTGEVGLRSLSALFGTLTIPLAYLAAAELSRRRVVALLAAAFVALNPYLVWYSQEARSYALMVLFASAALYYFARSLDRPGARPLALWALASALAICSHYFAAFLIAPQAIWLLARRTDRRRAAVAVAGVIVTGLALIPLAIAQEAGGRQNGFTESPLISRAGELSLNFVAGQEPSPFAGSRAVDALQLLALIGGAGLLALAIGLVAQRGSDRDRGAALITGVVGGGAIGVPLGLAMLGADFINPRNLIGALVPILILAAIGLGGARSGRVGLAGGGALCAMFAVVLVATNLSAQMQRPDWRGAADAIQASAPDARAFVVPRNGDDPLSYYLGVEVLHHGGPAAVRTDEIPVLSTTFQVRRPHTRFRLIDEQRLAPYFFLWPYAAGQPERVRLRGLTGDRVLTERAAVLFREGP